MEEIEDIHEEIKKILDFVDQRIKTVILILASTGMRIGALRTVRVGDLEKVNDIYKIKVYSGDVEEEYITFVLLNVPRRLTPTLTLGKDTVR